MTTLRANVSRLVAPMLLGIAIGCDGPTGPNERHLELVHATRDSSMSGETDLVLRSADGTTSRKLVALPGSESFPEWSPDGSQVVFSRSTDAQYRPWVVGADGSNPRPLLAGVGTYVVWSPDGKFIAFQRLGANCLEIDVARADGSEVRTLVECAFGPPSWSPDGRIAFVGVGGIRTVKSDGTGLAELVPEANVSWPRWSPDGSRLAFLQYVDVGPSYTSRQVVFVVNADGSGRRQLTTAGSTHAVNPSWSPDGEWVLFERGATGANDPGGCRLYRIPAAGGAEELLVTQPRGSGQCSGATWRR